MGTIIKRVALRPSILRSLADEEMVLPQPIPAAKYSFSIVFKIAFSFSIPYFLFFIFIISPSFFKICLKFLN